MISTLIIYSCFLPVIFSFPTDHLIARRDTSYDVCLTECPMKMNFVCGNDGMMYPNTCVFDCAKTFLNKDLESVKCPFDNSKESKAISDRLSSSDQDDTQQSSLSSQESKASKIIPGSNDLGDTQELLSLARLISKVEGKEKENDDYLELGKMFGEENYLISNELGHGNEKSSESTSMSIKSVENLHQNIWNALYALRKANQKLQSAKHAKQYVLRELDNIVLNLKDDEKISYDPNNNVMNTVDRLLKEKEQHIFPFKRHLIDYLDTPESTSQSDKKGKSLNVEIDSLEREPDVTDTLTGNADSVNNEEQSMNNKDNNMNKVEEHRTTVESIAANTSDRDEVTEIGSFKEDTEYTDAPDVFPSTETLDNYNKRLFTYELGPTSYGNDDHLFTIPFSSQTETTVDSIKSSEDIEREMDPEYYEENVDKEIDEITAIIDAMEERNTTEIVADDSVETTTIYDAMTEQTMTEFEEEVLKTELPEYVVGSSQVEIWDMGDEESEESITQQTEEKVEIKSRNRISDSNELFASDSKDPVWKTQDTTTQKVQKTYYDSNSMNRITESNELIDFDTKENAQRDSISSTDGDISALPTSTYESSEGIKEDVVTTESTNDSSDSIKLTSTSRIDASIDVSTHTPSVSSVDVTTANLSRTLSANSDTTDVETASTEASSAEVTTALATNSDVLSTGATNDSATAVPSTEDTIFSAASSSDRFVSAASVASDKELISLEEPILTGNEPIFIPHPVPEDSDDFDRLVYPDTSESIEKLFVGDESMNLPNYQDFIDRPRPIHL
ncbi:hypothetical protein WDU94_013084 [Cyamophila willieti]